MSHVSSGSFQGWRTPAALGAALVKEYECVLDAAADKDNALCPVFYDGSEGSDGLLQPWNAPGAGVWCNPPYADPGAWLEKGYDEVLVHGNCDRAVFLLPAAVGVSWFVRACLVAEVFLFDARIRYELPPREQLPVEYQDKLYRRTRRGPGCEDCRGNGTGCDSCCWAPKTSPGGGNALVVIERGGLVGITGIRSALTGALTVDFTDGLALE